jgi:hypothetical protein
MAFLGQRLVRLVNMLLNGHGTFDSIGGARKFGDETVARLCQHRPVESGDLIVANGPMGRESHKRACLILVHHPTVALDIRCQNCHEPAFDGPFVLVANSNSP